MADAKKGAEFTFNLALINMATGAIAVDPEIVAGDFQVSKDGGAFAALTNVPTTQTTSVIVTLTATEMDADNIVVYGTDVSDNDWDEVQVSIITSDSLADDLDVDGYNLEQTLKGIAAATMGVDNTPNADGPEYQAIDGSKTRITATEDRVTVTLDLD